ncbi:threonine synthase [Magnetovibrio sp.]|uniref:threonine synthase n=1 Tax=Magnetovibrio sp. TaxID=2024836 RepID=UPI002F925A00
MKYISTRGNAPKLAFDDVLLTGLARDGGLYLPESWPQFSAADLAEMKDMSYVDLAVKVMLPFVEDVVSREELTQIVTDTYGSFDCDDVAPLVKLGDNEYVLELFHGPTLAFKDYALQFLGRMFDHVLTKRGAKLTIVGATSGDTGSAAIEACRDRDNIEIFILHPSGKVSEVQRRQMSTVLSDNVHNIALKGNFDDCQNTVKALFADEKFRDDVNLSAVNSINWARIMAQVVYYFWAGLRAGAPDTSVAFAVPTGNFGNVFAGYVAKQMGLPISQFVIGSNANDILIRFIETGRMESKGVFETTSPSMDIQISSNFERFMFELLDRDSSALNDAMQEFKETGHFSVTDTFMVRLKAIMDGARFDDAGTAKLIGDVHKETGYLLDTHSAIGVGAARARRWDKAVPMVILATAHPAKFPDAVKAASGVHPELPSHLSDLYEREEKYTELPDSFETIKDYIETTLKERGKL